MTVNVKVREAVYTGRFFIKTLSTEWLLLAIFVEGKIEKR